MIGGASGVKGEGVYDVIKVNWVDKLVKNKISKIEGFGAYLESHKAHNE